MDFLRWQYKDVLNERLFADHLEAIPSKFKNDESWRRIFRPYILEDFRATLQASLQDDNEKLKRHRIQFTEQSIKKTIGLSKHSEVDLEVLPIVVDEMNRQKVEAPENLCGTLNVLIRTGSRFENGDSLLHTAHSFIYFMNFVERKGFFQCSIYSQEISHFHSILHDNGCDILLLQVPVMPTILAINHLDGFTPPFFIKDILTAEHDRRNSSRIPYRYSYRSESMSSLNESQQNAVEQIMCSHQSSASSGPAVTLIHGPPGTGKTSTLVSVIHNLFLQRRCTHITAPTNKAIRVLIEKYLDNFHKESGSIISDIVLVGRPKRLGIDPDHYLNCVTFVHRVETLKIASIDLPKAISEVRGYLRDFGLCRMYESMIENQQNVHDYSRFCRVYLKGSFDRIKRHLGLYATQHPLLIKLRSTEQKKMAELLARFSGWVDNLETHFNDKMLITWQQDMDTDDCRGMASYRGLYSAIDADISECYWLLQVLPLPIEGKEIGKLILDNALLVFSTVGSGASYSLAEKSEDYDVCIVDEATQLVEAYTAQVFSKHLQCLILAGDHKQLPATVISKVALSQHYDRSLFDRLISNNYPSVLLNTQYRMHPAICAWPNSTFYANKIMNGANVSDDTAHRREWCDHFDPISIFDAAHGVESDGPNGSKCNEFEERMVRALTNDFRKRSTQPTTLGIISPYKAQVANLQDLASVATSFNIIVSTVDGCQGQEFDIVIFSAVRANKNKNIGFLEDVRRLNVAITRPKYTLVLVCNVATVSADRTWRKLVQHIDSGGRIVKESPLITRVKQKYAAEQTNLDELLSPSGFVFEKCSWKISFTGEFKNSLSKSTKREKVLLLLQAIGQGGWTDDENLNKFSTELRAIIHISRVDNASRLIWSIDVQRSCDACKQCIKVWDICLVQDHSIEKCISKVQRGYSIYSDEYLARCMVRKSTIAFGRILMAPVEWEKDKNFAWTKTVVSDMATARDLEAESLKNSGDADNSVAFMKFYGLSSKVARILIKSSEPNLDLPFVMSEEEEEIVNFEGSAFILGRSGTGKTTVMLHRMLMEQHYLNEASSEVSARQIFVTASPVLCEAIKRSYESMRSSMARKEDSPAQLNTGLLTISTNNEEEQSIESLSFEEISSSKFPLIITYKVFMEIMLNSLRKTSSSNYFRIRKVDASNEIHFDTFRSFYYPHFPSEVTSKVDVKILYTEIRSVIKGSLEALASANGRLSESQYVALSACRSSELPFPVRELIYTAFEKYEQMKGVRGEYDMEDFVFFLYSGMEISGFRGIPCTSVFVDEVQDLSAAQIALFKYCCPNRAGFVMAGDTAQTISEGVGFRFEALKDIFFRHFLRGLEPAEAKCLTPNVWELTQNFRTHNGVLFIARKIVEMIVHFFPNSIDRMKPESSLVFGPKPIFLESQPGGDNMIAQLFQNESGAQNMVDFGAEQVILVRDEIAKELTLAKCGQNALVITALESKGMEFDDVLIVNFFSSSPFKNEWRVIENFLSSDDSDAKTSTSRRRFDPMKHGILNTELKMLYVLVTRAKKRLIIADDDPIARKPMLDLLLSEGLIERKVMDEDIRALFSGQQSSSEEWIQKGDAFMLKRQFSNAKYCFGKGGDTLKEQHANAAHFEQEGDRLNATDSKTSKERYVLSSELFRALNKLSDAVRCYEKAEEFEQAALIYETMTRWYDAGVCYEKVRKLERAAQVYWKCYEILHALRCAYACHGYLTAIEELKKIPQSFQPSDYSMKMTECARKGALYFHGRKKVLEMMNCISCFPSADSKRDFLKQYGYFDQVLAIELESGCFENAAKIYLEMSEFKEASKFFQKAGCHSHAIDCAVVALRQSCLDSDRLRLKTQYSVEGIEEVRAMLRTPLKPSHNSSVLLELNLIESVKTIDPDAAVELMRSAEKITNSFSRIQLLAIFRTRDLLADQIENRWLEFWESIRNLQKQLSIVLPSLDKGINDQPLSLLDRENIKECAAFFEGKLITKGLVSSILMCVLPFTKIMFNISGGGKENRKSHSMTISAFATVAAAYLRAELKASCATLSGYLQGRLESTSKMTLNAYIQGLEKEVKQPISSTTQLRLELLVPFLQVLRVEEDKSRYNLAVTKLSLLCFSEYSFLEDVKAVSEARIAGGVVRDCLKHFITRCLNPELKADMIAKGLLISELIGNIEEVSLRLEKVCANELRTRKKENEIDFRKLLVGAFAWEQSEHIPPNFDLGAFLYSLDQGFTAIDNDCWKGTIASCVYGTELPVTAKEKDGCISPQLFLKFIEKYTVLISAIRKNYTNVILPISLFEDVLCRCNKAYCNDILSCDSAKASPDRVKYSGQLALRIFRLLESIIEETTPPYYFAWFLVNSTTTIKEEDPNLQSAIFVLRIIILLKTIVANFTDPKLYDRYNKLIAKFDKLSSILDVLPENLRKKLKVKTIRNTDLQFFSSIQTALRDPLVVVNARPVKPPPFFIDKCKLLPKWITIDSNASSICSVDEKPGAAASSTLASEEEVIITESQVVDESVIEVARKEAEQGTLPPTKKEFPTEWMATILKERLQNARTRVLTLLRPRDFSVPPSDSW